MLEYYPTTDETWTDEVPLVQAASQIASSSRSTSPGAAEIETPSTSHEASVTESDEHDSSGNDSMPSGGESQNDELPALPSETEAPVTSSARVFTASDTRARAAFATSAEAAERGGSDGRLEPSRRLVVVLEFMLSSGFLLFVLAFWAGMMFGSSSHQKCKSSYPDVVYSPARAVQEYQSVRFDGGIKTTNVYKGAPGKELDEAWKALYDVGPLLVDKKELEAIGKKSIELPSRPGKHLAKLAVFHQLHCLDYVRRYVHREHYRIDDSHATVSGIDHADHCIDMIRQALSCSADPTLITFKQDSPLDVVEADFSATHACTNFEKVHGWAKDWAINMTEEIIHNPGPFKDAVIASLYGQGNKTPKP